METKIYQKNRDLFSEHKLFFEEWLYRGTEIKLFFGAKSKFEWQCGNIKSDDSVWKMLLQFRPSGIRVKRATYIPALVAMNQTSILGKYRRYLTCREVARAQSFPDNFKLHKTDAYKQFGNSINVDVVVLLLKILFDKHCLLCKIDMDSYTHYNTSSHCANIERLTELYRKQFPNILTTTNNGIPIIVEQDNS